MYINRQKDTFKYILLGFTILLLVLPFLASFNDILTRIVEGNLLYVWLEEYIVPLEAKMMGVILMALGYDFAFSPTNSTIVVNGLNMGISWNCLGWQSFLLFFLTWFAGIGRKYTRISLVEAAVIGAMGIFWVNIFRMIFTILLAVHLTPVFRVVFHDYLAAFVALLWLVFFWWFSYAFVLEEKGD